MDDELFLYLDDLVIRALQVVEQCVQPAASLWTPHEPTALSQETLMPGIAQNSARIA